ncbi:hypothetical protein VTJ83DRAFT_6290 [Remersonia thermophila]|uniref:Alpha-1,3/1,6-mannosyltransferase ALG2 n=1 Tax=Remersonia thermophila TaxID=72144 RepID=A0ABR4D4E3_9PEZI
MAGSNTQPSPKKKKKTIVFLHPDLGIGGAERLVIDAAVGLQNRGHRVVIFTSHCDPQHCFDEARDGTLDVRVRGGWLVPPTLLGGRFAILCAILRQVHLLLHVALWSGELRELGPPDVVFADQLSAGLPLLRALTGGRVPVFFYCHFPDLLLVQSRRGWLKRAYRAVFDALEGWSMGHADAVAVNSRFTRGIVAETWPGLAREKPMHVVYPCIDTTAAAAAAESGREEGDKKKTIQIDPHPWSKTHALLLSINRFERKKNLALALRAFAGLPPERRARARLVLAGGYDPRVRENVAHHAELVALCEAELGLRAKTASTLPSALALAPDACDVLFLLSAPGLLKESLLRGARLLVYTPPGEHFGIVPLEAMARGVPVLAADSGGPTETVVDGVTGWLRSVDRVDEWTRVMERVVGDVGREEERERMGRAGRERVRDKFDVGLMAERLDAIFEGMIEAREKKGPGGKGLGPWVVGLGAVAVVVAAVALAAGTVAR